MYYYIKNKIEIVFRKLAELYSRRKLSSNPEIWDVLQNYLSKTKSTGCSYIDYYQLYKQIRTRQPAEVLECGTGVTTLVIAHALMENERLTGIRGRVTSMEENDEWLIMSQNLLPSEYNQYVDFCLSDTVEDYFSLFRGMRYRDVPDRPYEFIFIDGPKYHSPIDNVPTFDFDLLHIIRNSDIFVSGLIDKRLSTCFVLQQLLGVDKVSYSTIFGLGFILPCNKHDLGVLPNHLSSENFSKYFKIFKQTKLRLTPIILDDQYESK